ncbi:MAG: transcriptional regulator [endosymbiont of Seepiophila jonesi]|uniref:Transcriptional regulator n=1 Tax=endosymbiont of Lamellibrachia luymesi TaxID=2200907 RepID=A0A370DX55_9GAMM|nr:MAG: transcriptional regulator [endosymbiont of Seepiophila jonesi]RDH89883.1 MAG: transcriptional regulator [endosymbiont of Lamellibrachia luymesi]
MKEKLYQYTGCGLDYIYLTNGYDIKKTPFGEGVTIHDLDGLHCAIATDLVDDRPNWTGAELRFIRKELGFTQQILGEFVSRDAQTVALWEKDKQPVPEEACNIIRGIYKSRIEGNVEFEKMIERINELDRQINDAEERMTAYKADSTGWHTAKAA